MIDVLTRFAQYNLLAALVAGAIAWAVVQAGIQLLGIRHGKLRLCLLLAPLAKSTLVLTGLTLVLPWPREVFTAWQARAVGPEIMIPVFLATAGLATGVRALAARRAVAAAVAWSSPAGERAPRLTASLERVRRAFESNRQAILPLCELPSASPRPDVRITDRGLRSPLVTTSPPYTMVFPRALLARLDDAQLDGAVAHELAHLYVRTPWSCLSSEIVRGLVGVNPLAALMAGQLDREEEKACDDIAVAALGDRDTYASMLLATYRFAMGAAPPLTSRLGTVSQLLGVKPMLSERIERLLGRSPHLDMARQTAGFVILWLVLATVIFQS